MSLMTEEGFKMATVNTKNSVVVTRPIQEPHKVESEISKEAEILAKLKDEIVKMMPTEPVEKTKPKEVLCKMMLKGKASTLNNTISNIMSNFYRSSSSYSKGFDKDVIVTFMVEDCGTQE